jgi:hypothetical protein
MNIAILNGRPVMVGTKLEYLDQARKEMWGDDYVVVTRLWENGRIEYEGNGGEVEGATRESELAKNFQHYNQVNPTPNEYAITCIADFLSIPDDKLDACFEELKLAIRSSRAVSAATIAEYEEIGKMTFTDQDKKVLWRAQLPVIVWQDNGKNTTDVLMNGRHVMTAQMSEQFDPMDVSVGDNEYFVVIDDDTKRNINAYDAAEANAKAKHHFGPNAHAVWRKYVGE